MYDFKTADDMPATMSIRADDGTTGVYKKTRNLVSLPDDTRRHIETCIKDINELIAEHVSAKYVNIIILPSHHKASISAHSWDDGFDIDENNLKI